MPAGNPVSKSHAIWSNEMSDRPVSVDRRMKLPIKSLTKSSKQLPCLSVTLAALLCFAGLNLILGRVYEFSKAVSSESSQASQAPKGIIRAIQQLNSMDETSIESAVNGFISAAPPANTVLMGSSLMMFPMWAVDKSVQPSLKTNKFEYHRSQELQRELRKRGVTDAVVYNMSTPLQMVSDSFMFMEKLFVGKRKPNTVVLGISPRDFWDAEFPQPGETMNFIDQVGLLDFPLYCNDYLPSLHSRAQFALSQCLFLYDKHSYIQHFAAEKLARAIAPKMVSPLMAGGTQFAFGVGRYQARYRGINIRALYAQMQFLDKICDFCDRNNINLILINMPLPSVNRNLMNPEFYRAYQRELAQLAEAKHVHFLDLADRDEFKSDLEYSDAAHMNKLGGELLIKQLACSIAADSCE